ncbi:hypothetical protein FOA43_002549 [Brettanomyces nanus]|uniref:Elongator complex protein 5 n=1 Tax=Eeniella nana TaxID=13502 RepID=A0A875S634_EENNA|nr:uncharacterized protein FOA43_002549 [Brettanomyces nanus]QPG75199.1 hypothetical protein FOA43_002549 [Brettanomyces nanus]
MSISIASGPVLLNRILTLRESSPFLLALDTILQSSQCLTSEFIYKIQSTGRQIPIVYISFETTEKPEYVDTFIEALDVPMEILQLQISAALQVKCERFIIVDSFNYVHNAELNPFLRSILDPLNIIYGTYHLDVPSSRDAGLPNKPPVLSILKFIATSVFELRPFADNLTQNELGHMTTYLDIPIGECNRKVFKLMLIFRRKSGRAMHYQLSINSASHQYTQIVSNREGPKGQDEKELLNDLTTFNLTTTRRQKKVRDQVELPFMEAQKFLGFVAGSTVYEFDKDDDYDDDDDDDDEEPYEDPM